ncbi:5'-nucleotidase domain-containing protein 3 isoform X2 [Cherax quadricarinatus]|uniref:5'-nucleotidase domain-containing protein 3 isoform X2 n=1 Tax=Cherax quadricarinatus TaxID=27406 RepID=UPI00387E9309
MRSLQSIRSLFLAPVRSGSLLEVVTYTVMGSSAKREYSQEFLQKCYDDHRALWESKKQPENVNPRAVFASNELDLRDIKVYGFDYDYTLAHYEEAVEHLIYDLGKNVLISKYRQNKMAHLADLFSLPEMCLLSQVAQYFLDNNIPYHSVPLFNDVKAAIASIHPEMHRVVGRNISEYLIKDPSLVDFFDRLKKHNKEIFIITNSPFYFVNAGMSYILGENWRDYFDVVVANAKKPAFFTDSMRPFRELNEEIHVQTWGPVTSLDKGKIYLEQTFGLPMGSPLSAVLVNLYMEHLEAERFSTIIPSSVTWLHYVDNILLITPKRFNVQALQDKLNQVEPSIQFTLEEEVDNTVPFLMFCSAKLTTNFVLKSIENPPTKTIFSTSTLTTTPKLNVV